jgi:hypothetical protein
VGDTVRRGRLREDDHSQRENKYDVAHSGAFLHEVYPTGLSVDLSPATQKVNLRISPAAKHPDDILKDMFPPASFLQ